MKMVRSLMLSQKFGTIKINKVGNSTEYYTTLPNMTSAKADGYIIK